MATEDALRIKFRQSKDYTHEMLVRDMIQYAIELEKKFEAQATEIQTLKDRLTAAGIP